MITEDYTSFETARLLKEKGFNEKCRALYTFWFDEVEGPKEDEAENWNIEPKYFSAPTIQMTMKWLREVHNIAIETEWEHLWYTYIKPMTSKPSEEDYYQCESSKYEEACEAAIKYCLENLVL